ncbi:pentapeptide repeat-containing protein [Streptomyces sp. BA2]|uniref:pentapeptide repeat-containing protein n=1 Tax=Streptomyces sp. BA2 TaxID=436595 RepID=UPI00136D69B4
MAAAAAALCVGLPWLVWKAPYVMDSRYIDEETVGEGTGSAALVTGLRTALVACIAALGAGIALLYTARTYRLNHRGQVTDRFTKALERLGSDRLYVRIGGILALEQIVQDAPEQATDAARVLSHFLRDGAPRTPKPPATAGEPSSGEPDPAEPLPDEPAADIQVALTALTRPESRTHVDPREPLDLHGLHLAGANLQGADLTGADLVRTTLTQANLQGATCTNANLREAALTWANLTNATLTGANLTEATLANAKMRGATLAGAVLVRATLTRTFMSGTTLTHTDLRDATLNGADLRDATLEGANLKGADLTDARELFKEQIDAAGVDSRTILPSHLFAGPPPPPARSNGAG